VVNQINPFSTWTTFSSTSTNNTSTSSGSGTTQQVQSSQAPQGVTLPNGTTLPVSVVISPDVDLNDPLLTSLPENTLVVTGPYWADHPAYQMPAGFQFPGYSSIAANNGAISPSYIYIQDPDAAMLYQATGFHLIGSPNTFEFYYDTGFGSYGYNSSYAHQWNTMNGLVNNFVNSGYSDNLTATFANNNVTTTGSTVSLPTNSGPPAGTGWTLIGTEMVPSGTTESTTLPVGTQPQGTGWTAGQLLSGQPFSPQQFEYQTLPQGIDPGNGWMATGNTSQQSFNPPQFETMQLASGSAAPGNGWVFTGTSSGGGTGQFISQTLPITAPAPGAPWVLKNKIFQGDTLELPQGVDPPAGWELIDTHTYNLDTETVQLPHGQVPQGDGWHFVQSIDNGTGQFETQTVGPNDPPPSGDGWILTDEHPIIAYNTTYSSGEVGVGTNLDGTSDWGFYGNWLESNQVGDPNFIINELENGNNLQQFSVNGLFGTNSHTLAQDTNVIDTNLADGIAGDHDHEGYLAGDPVVGNDQTNYAPTTVDPASVGYYTFHQDYDEDGAGWEIVDHIKTINSQGNKANTEYGFVLTDESGDVTKVGVSGGVVTINPPNGAAPTTFQDDGSGNPYTIYRDDGRVLAKFYYADMPGGENGTTERRLVADKYEYPSDSVRQQLLDSGVSQTEVDNLVGIDQMTLGFRIPDGQGSYRMSAGVAPSQAPINQSKNVGTYYDVHLNLGPTHTFRTNNSTCTPIYGNVYQRELIDCVDVYERQNQETKNVYQQAFNVYEMEETCSLDNYERETLETLVEYKKELTQDLQVWNRPEMEEHQLWQQSVNTVNTNVTLECPLVLDFNNDGQVTGNTTQYADMNGDGVVDEITHGWNNEDALMVFDGDGDGQSGMVNGNLSSMEMLGNRSDVNRNGVADDNFANGFDALRSLAASQLGEQAVADNKLDADELAQLTAQTGFGFIVNNQFKTAAELNITSINLDYTENDVPDGNGNVIRQHGSFAGSGDTVGYIGDAWLQYQQQSQQTGTSDALNTSSSLNQSQVNYVTPPSDTDTSDDTPVSEDTTDKAEDTVVTTTADDDVSDNTSTTSTTGNTTDTTAVEPQLIQMNRPLMGLPAFDPFGSPVSSIMDLQGFQMMFWQFMMAFLMQMIAMGPPSYYPQGMPRRFYVNNNQMAA